MVKVITYGTYDLLHYGHIRLLERAKELGDYLIVGVTSDDYDKTRGKINLQQSLMERVEAVRNTGIADEIIIEEYEGQKIDDIKRYAIDIFTVGSDWEGQFDYLNEYCKVVYLPRTEGVSSTEIREKKRSIALGLVGDTSFMNKVAIETRFVNGIHLTGICTDKADELSEQIRELPIVTNRYCDLLEVCDALYIRSRPEEHYNQIKIALEADKHVLCESPICLDVNELIELRKLAKDKDLILIEAIKTAYSTAFSRLSLLVKSGRIGDVVSISTICTSVIENKDVLPENANHIWDGIYEWGPTALLPIFQLLGENFKSKNIAALYSDSFKKHDSFVKADFIYNGAVATIQIGNRVKSEGDMVVAGTKGYIYVPAPWWKTEYFEIRYENPSDNKRYFYQLEGEGIRYELVAFARSIEKGKSMSAINDNTTEAIVQFMSDFENKVDVTIIN